MGLPTEPADEQPGVRRRAHVIDRVRSDVHPVPQEAGGTRGGGFSGIRGDGGDRIGCKWYQHVLVPDWTAADAVAVSWSADEDAILIARNGEVGQVVANE